MEGFIKLGSVQQYAINEEEYKNVVERVKKEHEKCNKGLIIKTDTTPELEELKFSNNEEQRFYVNIYTQK